jgi:preprotein translocase subunit SecE
VAKAVRNKQDKSGKAADGKGRKPAESRQSRAKTPAKAGARNAKRPQGKGAAGERRGLSKFFHDVRIEMGKVTWPSRQDLVQSTIVVLVAVAIAAAFVGVLDVAFSEFVNAVLRVIT